MIAKMASGSFEDEAETTVTIDEYIESMDAEELVISFLFTKKSLFFFTFRLWANNKKRGKYKP